MSMNGDYLCAECHEPLETMSDENDFVCRSHGFVNAIRPDGMIIAGDGTPGPERVLYPARRSMRRLDALRDALKESA